MNDRLTPVRGGASLPGRPGRLGMLALLGRPRTMWRFLTQRGAPIVPRIIALLALAYLVMPLDAVPDLVPLLGWLDDLGVVTTALGYVAAQAARFENARLDAAAPQPAPR
jgi:uncharacterized membrane protein YkvA (DUF1232 family)